MVGRTLNVTHNSKRYDVEIDLDDTVEVLKLQLFSLTQVPPENQKLIGLTKGSVMKDDVLLSNLDIKEGQKVMMMGTPGAAIPSTSGTATAPSSVQAALDRLRRDSASDEAFKLSLGTLVGIMSKCGRRAEWPKPWADAGHPLLKVVGNETFAARAGGPAGVELLKLFGFVPEGAEHIALREPNKTARQDVLDAVRAAGEGRDEPTAPPQATSADVPVFSEDIIAWKTCCSRVFISEPVIQPAFAYLDQHTLCYACATTCHLPGAVKPAVKRTADGALAPGSCACAQIAGRTCLFAERLSNPADKVGGKTRTLMAESLAAEAAGQATQLAALEAQSKAREQDAGKRELVASLETHARSALVYEDPILQQKARDVVPIETLRERARTNPAARPSERDELMVQLLRWFKHEFFQWVNAPPCDRCGGATNSVGMGQPTPEESAYGAGRVEVYTCPACGAVTRFPRYNDPGKLLETRRGRCGEWANCFTLLCRALGFEARYVYDVTDHVWTEIYSEHLARWVHTDPCENAFDAPLMYEAGWGKQLSYIFAFSAEEVVDVAQRYTNKWHELLSRRTKAQEDWLQGHVTSVNRRQQSALSPPRRALLAERSEKERVEMWDNCQGKKNLSDAETHGRISGDVAWRSQRGELGPGAAVQADCLVPDDSCATTVVPELEDEDLGSFSTSAFDFAEFSPSDPIEFVGTAELLRRNPPRVRLTPKRNGAVGAMWHKARQPLLNGFETEFRFQITEPGADGFAFVIQNAAARAMGQDGCQLGYGGIAKSLAVEFDTYQSSDRTNDPNGNHISVHTKGAQANSAEHAYSLGCATRFGGQLNDGRPHTVRITYHGHVLRVYYDGSKGAVLKVEVDLAEILHAVDRLAWVGFTASCGGLTENHDILAWRLALPDNSSTSDSSERTVLP